MTGFPTGYVPGKSVSSGSVLSDEGLALKKRDWPSWAWEAGLMDPWPCQRPQSEFPGESGTFSLKTQCSLGFLDQRSGVGSPRVGQDGSEAFLVLCPHRGPRSGQDRPGPDLPQRRSPLPEELHAGEARGGCRPGRGLRAPSPHTARSGAGSGQAPLVLCDFCATRECGTQTPTLGMSPVVLTS